MLYNLVFKLDQEPVLQKTPNKLKYIKVESQMMGYNIMTSFVGQRYSSN